MRPYLKNNLKQKGWGVFQVVERLHEALCANHSITEREREKKGRKGGRDEGRKVRYEEFERGIKDQDKGKFVLLNQECSRTNVNFTTARRVESSYKIVSQKL
jgi:hypothetical protein